MTSAIPVALQYLNVLVALDRALATLDALEEHVAAAHVSMAIELIAERIDSPCGPQ